MKPPSLYKVAVIIVTIWIIFLYQQYLHTATHYLKTTSQNQNYIDFDPMRRMPLCRDHNGTIRSNSRTERFDLDHKRNDDQLESSCRREFHRWTVDMPDHVRGLTSEDYERSIAHVGNRYRIATFVQKLILSTQPMTNTITNSNSSNLNDAVSRTTSTPVTVIVCGGSITMGHGVEPQSGRYSDALETWLNAAYPVFVDDVDASDQSATKEPFSDGSYNYRNDYPHRHRVYMRGGHGANVCITRFVSFLVVCSGNSAFGFD